MIPKRSLLLAVLLFPFLSHSQDVSSFTIEEAVKYAQDNNLTIKNAQINIADARQQIIERQAIGIPQLRGSVGYNYFIDIPTQILPDFLSPTIYGILFQEGLLEPRTIDTDNGVPAQFGTKHNLSAGLDLSVMAFDASYFIGLRAARMFKDYSAQELIATRRDIRYRVIKAYLPVLLVDENLQIFDRNIANLEKLLQETRALYREGFVELLDVDRLELSLANLGAERENLARQREVAINALKFIMGFPMDQPLEVSGQLSGLSPELAEQDLAGPVFYAARPEYTLVGMGESLNQMNVRLNRSGYIPTLNLFASYQASMYANKFSEGEWFPTTVVGAQLNVPIFDGFGKKARVQRSRLALDKVRNQKLDLERAISLEVRNARTAYLSARERMEAQKRNLELAERIFQTTQIKYREGVGSSIEISQAEQGLYQTQQLHIQALFDLVTAKTDLEKALGK